MVLRRRTIFLTLAGTRSTSRRRSSLQSLAGVWIPSYGPLMNEVSGATPCYGQWRNRHGHQRQHGVRQSTLIYKLCRAGGGGGYNGRGVTTGTAA